LEKFTIRYGCKTNNEIQTNKNIERMQNKQQDTNTPKRKRLLNEL
jgi:hypothetical protein